MSVRECYRRTALFTKADFIPHFDGLPGPRRAGANLFHSPRFGHAEAGYERQPARREGHVSHITGSCKGLRLVSPYYLH